MPRPPPPLANSFSSGGSVNLVTLRSRRAHTLTGALHIDHLVAGLYQGGKRIWDARELATAGLQDLVRANRLESPMIEIYVNYMYDYHRQSLPCDLAVWNIYHGSITV